MLSQVNRLPLAVPLQRLTGRRLSDPITSRQAQHLQDSVGAGWGYLWGPCLCGLPSGFSVARVGLRCSDLAVASEQGLPSR